MRYGIKDWDRAVEALVDADQVVVAGHVNPDGDALGSVLAASLGLRALGKRTWPTWGDEDMAVPAIYEFMPAADSFVAADDVPPDATLLALDCGAADRLGSLERLIETSSVVINVDHHPGNDNFGHINVVATDASSTAELTMGLLLDAGADIDRDIATCLYTGIVTDTGRFQYSNTSPAVLRVSADLLALGVPSVEIAQELFESSPFGYLKLVGRVLDRAELYESEAFVYSWLTQKDLEETKVPPDETDKLIDLIRSTRAARVAAMFKEQGDGTYRASLRSKGPVSVGAIAREHGGGGHDLAAGFSVPSVAEGVEGILAALRPKDE